MKVSLIKKSFSIILAVVMLLTMVPATVFAAEKDLPVMKAYRTVTGDYHDYKKQVVTVTFLDKIDTSGALQSWDVSENGDGSVMAWMKKNEEKSAAAGAARYDVYIGGEGGVSANPVSSDVFFGFENLEEINGFEHFDTSKATTFAYMFQQCYSIKTLDLSSFDTSNVTNFLWLFVDCISLETVNLNGWDTSEVKTMDSMFKNCVKLNPLDISSFNTAKAVNMANMFYRCESLKTLYVGDGWILDQVTSSNAMFNCCYLIEGKKSYNDPSVSLPHDKKYATTDYFVTYKAPDALKEYTVSYEFKGDVIPEDVTLPDAFRYNEGSIIEVAGAPSAEGYAFSGWTTDDTTVEDGKFAVNNDVHFVGTWTKLYKVEYRYADGFEVPEGAPELPEAVYYKAGDDVDKLGIPYVYRHIFVGWTTDDADATSDIFTMPENDVVFYGYFKIPVESIEVIGGDITVNAGEKEKITVYVKPEDATIKDIVYKSSDESIVKVDEYGNITAVGEGTATVTVASKDDPTKSDTVTVNVKIPVTELVVDKTEITLKKDGTDKINATVNGDATNKKVIFESDNENIVTVDENGNLKAVGEGTTTVTVKSEDDPSITATVTVTVKNPVTEITATEDFTLNVGDEKNLEAKVNEDATNKELIYESDNPGVVKVDSNGDVRAVGEGTATITITSKDNPSITETVTVTVKIPVSDVTVDKDEITLNKGDKDTIVPVVTPDNATNKEVTYTSSDETVVKVDENGNIEAVGKGEATITITSKDNPSEFVTVKVTVEIPVEDVVSDKSSLTLKEGDTDKITVTVTPDDATNKEVTYTSSDETVVKVDENGNIEAVGEGEATITVSSKDDPSKKVEIPVKVEKKEVPVENIEVDKTELTLKEGDTDKITATVTPDDATNKEVTYTSSDETVVKIDENGNIEAVGEGEATITVSSADGGKQVTVKVTVKAAEEPTDPEEPSEPDVPDEPEKPEYTITVPELMSIYVSQVEKLKISITPDDGSIKPIFTSSDESVVTVDADGIIRGIAPGTATITVDFGNGDVRLIPVTVLAVPVPVKKHHICFGKTDGIGWYEVSVNGGDFFPQGPNSTLEVEEGSVLVVRVQDMWIDDEFDFYVNGSKVPMDAANTITVVVDGYMLIGALSMDVEVPDVEESLTFLDKILNFFAGIFNWFKNLFR